MHEVIIETPTVEEFLGWTFDVYKNQRNVDYDIVERMFNIQKRNIEIGYPLIVPRLFVLCAFNTDLTMVDGQHGYELLRKVYEAYPYDTKNSRVCVQIYKCCTDNMYVQTIYEICNYKNIHNEMIGHDNQVIREFSDKPFEISSESSSVSTPVKNQPRIIVPKLQPLSVSNPVKVQPQIVSISTLQPQVASVPKVQSQVASVPKVQSQVASVPKVQSQVASVPKVQSHAGSILTAQPQVAAITSISHVPRIVPMSNLPLTIAERKIKINTSNIVYCYLKNKYGSHFKQLEETAKQPIRAPHLDYNLLVGKLTIFDNTGISPTTICDSIIMINDLYSRWDGVNNELFTRRKGSNDNVLTDAKRNSSDKLNGFYLTYYSTHCDWLSVIQKHLNIP